MRAVQAAVDTGLRRTNLYRPYWHGLTAKNDGDVFQRFLFAFCSVHTSWASNVKGYEAIRNYSMWLGSENTLRLLLEQSRVGLHNGRAKNIHRFADDFWQDPSQYRKSPLDQWWSLRDEIADRVNGLGMAKVSFALELSYPTEFQGVCLDTHMLDLYGEKGTPVSSTSGKQYTAYCRMESDWVGRCAEAQEAPFVVKQAYWDERQGRADSRYWSACLE